MKRIETNKAYIKHVCHMQNDCPPDVNSGLLKIERVCEFSGWVMVVCACGNKCKLDVVVVIVAVPTLPILLQLIVMLTTVVAPQKKRNK